MPEAAYRTENEFNEDNGLVWTRDLLNNHDEIEANSTLDFTFVKNKSILKCVQSFCIDGLHQKKFSSVYKDLRGVRKIVIWLEKRGITNLSDVTRDLIEEFLIDINTGFNYSNGTIQTLMKSIKYFFDWGYINEIENMPHTPLILSSDICYKYYNKNRALTTEEVDGIVSVLPKMKNPYRKMVYILLMLGMRFSELAYLKSEALKKSDDGQYYLDLEQYKTNTVNGKPVTEAIAKSILDEISKNKKKFGNIKYVFVNRNNKPICNGVFNNYVNQVLAKNNVLGRDGKILHVTSHQFRATVATGLASSGVDPNEAASILGQKSINTYSHYATVRSEVVKEELKFRIDKDNYIISNIDNFKEPIEMPKSTTPLCNGFCSRDPRLGGCAKANECLHCSMFIPDIKMIFNYRSQLDDLKLNAKLAKSEGMDSLCKKLSYDIEALEKIITILEEKYRKEA